jgi:hypothetical protein
MRAIGPHHVHPKAAVIPHCCDRRLAASGRDACSATVSVSQNLLLVRRIEIDSIRPRFSIRAMEGCHDEGRHGVLRINCVSL